MERLISTLLLSFSLIQSFETDDCWISIVENSGKKSIVKQMNSSKASFATTSVINC